MPWFEGIKETPEEVEEELDLEETEDEEKDEEEDRGGFLFGGLGQSESAGDDDPFDKDELGTLDLGAKRPYLDNLVRGVKHSTRVSRAARGYRTGQRLADEFAEFNEQGFQLPKPAEEAVEDKGPGIGQRALGLLGQALGAALANRRKTQVRPRAALPDGRQNQGSRFDEGDVIEGEWREID